MWHQGILQLSTLQLVLVLLILTHITIVSVTVYLHRYSAHRALQLNGGLKHFFRKRAQRRPLIVPVVVQV